MTSRPPAASGAAPRRAARMLLRAGRLRCPNCGRGQIFITWLKLRYRCPACDLLLERGESDYFIGAYLLNLIIAELIVVALMVVLVLATWPAVPWTAVTWGIALLTIPAATLTYPYSRSLWLAIDLIFRPPEESDFSPGADVIEFPRGPRTERPPTRRPQ
ncbi:MAG: DUF983 domain-containing protein [Gemmatimonadetes bacterium]|nr:DUF983 domain-containing protein [Gemmatimonadota bacterium]